DSHFKIVKLSRNFGHQAAVTAGMKYVKGDAIMIMDSDLQDPPEEISRFLEKWREGYDVVYAIRTKRKESIFKRMAYNTFYKIFRLISNLEIPLNAGDFCLMDRKVLDVMNREMPESRRFLRGLRTYAGFKQIGVEYERAERVAGKSHYTFRKLLTFALDGLFDFSTFPLRIATYIGFLISIPSFMIGTYYIVQKVFGFKLFGYFPSETPGLATLAVGMFFLSGIMLIILGIIGEYIGRIYLEVKGRPFYIVEEVFVKEQEPVISN
ncbi:MAG: glycosyltransferase, partial [Bacteroidetes bacterium]|nr:glycosyltransferase [Bacteroidota bacterium]